MRHKKFDWQVQHSDWKFLSSWVTVCLMSFWINPWLRMTETGNGTVSKDNASVLLSSTNIDWQAKNIARVVLMFQIKVWFRSPWNPTLIENGLKLAAEIFSEIGFLIACAEQNLNDKPKVLTAKFLSFWIKVWFRKLLNINLIQDVKKTFRWKLIKYSDSY